MVPIALIASAPLEAQSACSDSVNTLISSCPLPLQVALVDPVGFDPSALPDLAVTGTYSSGDRLGIEGLAVLNGEIRSRRLQGWDGVLIIDRSGQPEIFNARRIKFADNRFNIKDADQATDLLSVVADHGASMIQSHLLISDGVLDLRNVENAPVFNRRLFYQRHDGEFGIWQPSGRLTLYDAAVQLQEELQPKMALNLDMGTYDFCRTGDGRDCGRLGVGFDRLTNILTFTYTLDPPS